jgi:hypothetical protein
VPCLTGFEDHLETEPAIGIDRPRRRAGHGNGQGATEVGIAIGGAQLLPRFRPLRRDSSSAHNAARFHLEDIGKVAPRRDLQLKPHALDAMVGEVDILMKAASDRAADRKPDRALRNRSVLARQRTVGQKDAAGVVADGAAIDWLPRLAIGIDGPTAEDARIAEIEAFFAGPFDLAVGLADQHRLALVDGDLLWTDLHLERHMALRTARWWIARDRNSALFVAQRVINAPTRRFQRSNARQARRGVPPSSIFRWRDGKRHGSVRRGRAQDLETPRFGARRWDDLDSGIEK